MTRQREKENSNRAVTSSPIQEDEQLHEREEIPDGELICQHPEIDQLENDEVPPIEKNNTYEPISAINQDQIQNDDTEKDEQHKNPKPILRTSPRKLARANTVNEMGQRQLEAKVTARLASQATTVSYTYRAEIQKENMENKRKLTTADMTDRKTD
jgi:hypothetical protein